MRFSRSVMKIIIIKCHLSYLQFKLYFYFDNFIHKLNFQQTYSDDQISSILVLYWTQKKMNCKSNIRIENFALIHLNMNYEEEWSSVICKYMSFSFNFYEIYSWIDWDIAKNNQNFNIDGYFRRLWRLPKKRVNNLNRRGVIKFKNDFWFF